MTNQPTNLAPGTMTLLDHLRELRSRLVKASLAIVLGMIVGFVVVYNTELVPHIIRTFIGEQGVQITEVTEAFTTTVTLALTLGIIIAMPIIVYQLLAFLTPGMTAKEKRWVYFGLPLVIFFFVAGLVFGWFVTAPATIHFLVGLGPGLSEAQLIENKPKLQDSLSILTWLLIMNGIIFELPIIVFTLIKLKVLNPRRVARYRRYIVLGVVVISAIITPTGDPANLALVAIPMYLLFELGLVLGRFA